MWVEIKQAKSLAIAEMWKEYFEGEGIPARIMPVNGVESAGQDSLPTASWCLKISDT